MEIKAYPMEPAESTSVSTPDQVRMMGVVKLPQGSRIVHVGAAPPKGEMFAYCEVSLVTMPEEVIDLVVLQVGATIPNGYEYLGYILAIPILFIYRRKADGILHG